MLRPGTYLINEDLLREKMLNFEVNLCESQWNILEQEISQSKIQSAQIFNNFSAKILIIPTVIIIAGSILYFNISKMYSSRNSELNNSAEVKISEASQKITVVKKPEVPVKRQVNADSLRKVQEAETKAKAEAEALIRAEEEKAKQAALDSVKVLNDSSQVQSETPKKKKKKRRKRKSFESIENIRNGAFDSGNSGDDVVVPN
jgi:hypothetical protein